MSAKTLNATVVVALLQPEPEVGRVFAVLCVVLCWVLCVVCCVLCAPASAACEVRGGRHGGGIKRRWRRPQDSISPSIPPPPLHQK